MITHPQSPHRLPLRQGGSYLLEALVAILIFAFGVLGLIGLLGNSIRITNDARYRSEAANLASAMIADMWGTTAVKIDTEFCTGCAKQTSWSAKAAALLPGAKTEIDLSQPDFSTESRNIAVTVSWQMPGEAERHKYLMTAQIGKNR